MPHLQRVMVEAVADPKEFGYVKLYALLLGKCQKQLAAALRVFTHPDNFPLLVNCVQGKDRTGLIAMLVLMLCGVPHVVRLQLCSLHGHACIQLSMATVQLSSWVYHMVQLSSGVYHMVLLSMVAVQLSSGVYHMVRVWLLLLG